MGALDTGETSMLTGGTIFGAPPEPPPPEQNLRPPNMPGEPAPATGPAIETSPSGFPTFKPTEQSDKDLDKTLLANADKADAEAFGNVLSHYGDNRFLNPQPQRPTLESLQQDPEYQTLMQAEQYINERGKNQKPADVARAIAMVNKRKAELVKRVEDQYKADHATWKKTESEQLKGVEGDKISGASLEQHWATIEEQRKALADKTKADTSPKGQLEAAGSAVNTMKDSAFNEAALRIAQYNNLPIQRATETLLHLAGPNGNYNKRSGIAGANFKLAGTDVMGNVWLETENGKIRVPPAVYENIEMARRKGYKDLQRIERDLEKKPKPRGVGQFVVDQFK